MSSTSSIVVIGLGNEYRSDDAAGLMAARRIGEQAIPAIGVVTDIADGAALVDAWYKARLAFVIDGTASGSEPGTIFRFDMRDQKIPSGMFTTWSSHVFDLVKTIEFAEALGRLPSKLIVYGIEGRTFNPGLGLSDSVLIGVEGVVRRIIDEIEVESRIALDTCCGG